VDIYRSDNPRSNEYVYHNIGNSLQLLSPLRQPLKIKKASFPISKEPFDPPGFRMIQNYRSTGKISDGVIALFQIKDQAQTRFMQAIFPGEEGREFYAANGPVSPTAPGLFKTLPTPTLICRQQGEAWTRPFITVYEPYSGDNQFTVQRVEKSNHNAPADFTSLKVTCKNGNEQLILQSLKKDELYSDQQVHFMGNFAVVALEQNKLSYLYIGNGTELSYENYALRVLDGNGAVYLSVNGNQLTISCNQETLVTIKGRKTTKVTLTTATGSRNLVYEEDNDAISFMVPAVKLGNILLIPNH